MATGNKIAGVLKQREITPNKKKIKLPEGVIDLAIKQVENVQRPEAEFQHIPAKFPEGNRWLTKSKVVGFNHQNVGLFQRLHGTGQDRNLNSVGVQFNHDRPRDRVPL